MKILKKTFIQFFNFLFIVSFLFFINLTITPSLFPTIQKQTASTQRAYSYVWYYKTVNGILYKRLYNETTEEWASAWIPA